MRGGDVVPVVAAEFAPLLGQCEGFLLVVAFVTPLDAAVPRRPRGLPPSTDARGR